MNTIQAVKLLYNLNNWCTKLSSYDSIETVNRKYYIFPNTVFNIWVNDKNDVYSEYEVPKILEPLFKFLGRRIKNNIKD